MTLHLETSVYSLLVVLNVFHRRLWIGFNTLGCKSSEVFAFFYSWLLAPVTTLRSCKSSLFFLSNLFYPPHKDLVALSFIWLLSLIQGPPVLSLLLQSIGDLCSGSEWKGLTQRALSSLRVWAPLQLQWIPLCFHKWRVGLTAVTMCLHILPHELFPIKLSRFREICGRSRTVHIESLSGRILAGEEEPDPDRTPAVSSSHPPCPWSCSSGNPELSEFRAPLLAASNTTGRFASELTLMSLL